VSQGIRPERPVNNSAEAPRLLYDRKGAARMLSISLRSLAYLLSRGEIRFRRIGSKTLIPHAELVRFARGHHPTSFAGQQVSPEQTACARATDERNAPSLQ
jgi:excisionase family DNA binding protein